MLKFKKALDIKVISLILIAVLFMSTSVYAIGLSNRAHLRAPLMTNDNYGKQRLTETLVSNTLASNEKLSLKGKKILIVQDDPPLADSRKFFCAMKGAEENDIIIAPDYETAINALNTKKFDLIILDMGFKISTDKGEDFKWAGLSVLEYVVSNNMIMPVLVDSGHVVDSLDVIHQRIRENPNRYPALGKLGSTKIDIFVKIFPWKDLDFNKGGLNLLLQRDLGELREFLKDIKPPNNALPGTKLTENAPDEETDRRSEQVAVATNQILEFLSGDIDITKLGEPEKIILNKKNIDRKSLVPGILFGRITSLEEERLLKELEMPYHLQESLMVVIHELLFNSIYYSVGNPFVTISSYPSVDAKKIIRVTIEQGSSTDEDWQKLQKEKQGFDTGRTGHLIDYGTRRKIAGTSRGEMSFYNVGIFIDESKSPVLLRYTRNAVSPNALRTDFYVEFLKDNEPAPERDGHITAQGLLRRLKSLFIGL